MFVLIIALKIFSCRLFLNNDHSFRTSSVIELQQCRTGPTAREKHPWWSLRTSTLPFCRALWSSCWGMAPADGISSRHLSAEGSQDISATLLYQHCSSRRPPRWVSVRWTGSSGHPYWLLRGWCLSWSLALPLLSGCQDV